MIEVTSAPLRFQKSAEPQVLQNPRLAKSEAAYQVSFSAPSISSRASSTSVAA
jgi:hypothetical protein